MDSFCCSCSFCVCFCCFSDVNTLFLGGAAFLPLGSLSLLDLSAVALGQIGPFRRFLIGIARLVWVSGGTHLASSGTHCDVSSGDGHLGPSDTAVQVCFEMVTGSSDPQGSAIASSKKEPEDSSSSGRWAEESDTRSSGGNTSRFAQLELPKASIAVAKPSAPQKNASVLLARGLCKTETKDVSIAWSLKILHKPSPVYASMLGKQWPAR